ncbi:uncharacterized protein LOC134649446 [Cydia amplana]|uniref:uncharacterized protein LOC134649446 n=1 Tax=Cydia amplana TaxID=1869771 RepID=UPI002FE6938A
MTKLRFEFTILPGSDEKTNVCCITSITTEDNKSYALPDGLQSVGHHKELIKTAAYSKVKNSLSKRYQTRRIWISLTEELEQIYMDEDGNVQFADRYLEELNQDQCASTAPTAAGTKGANTLENLLAKLIESTQESKQQSLKNIADKFVIEKFTSKHSNAAQWMDIFEKECERYQISDEKKIEVLRLFMDKSCADWYSSMIVKLTMNAEWSEWRKKFCESFVNKGWSPVTYALLYKYKDGSLLDYAIKKEKLLLNMRKSIDSGTLVDLIAVGLPEYILNKIDREALKDTVELFNEVSKYEHMVTKKSYIFKKKYGPSRTNFRNEELKPCKICEGLNKGTRYHAETACWFRTKEDDKVKKNFIKHVNNALIEAELNESVPKNEY